MDIFGEAFLDYFSGNYTDDIFTETNISEEDIFPLPYSFRSYEEMPDQEKKALDLATGKVLDAGCGAGCHALYLQQKGLHVTAIDTSPGAVEVCRLQGLKNIVHTDLLSFKNQKFDTILLLMNGTGIFGNLKKTPGYLHHLRSLLNPNGQILIDSSDLRYMYDTDESGEILFPEDRYYGELEFTISYKNRKSKPFEWLYLDEKTFRNLSQENGFRFEVLYRGSNWEYLARLTF